MPYAQGSKLPGEKASKLGHLEVLKSPLVQQLVHSFEEEPVLIENSEKNWIPYPTLGTPLDLVFSVDGSIQVLEDTLPPRKALAFVKTALLRIDQVALAKIDHETPHPFAIRDLMIESALYHATVFPLRHVQIHEISIYDTIRQIIFESIKDSSLDGQPMETLKWLVYEKWGTSRRSLPGFKCPHCENEQATLPYDAEIGNCTSCGNKLYITDMLGFHLDMVEDSASDSVATSYMNIHETLLLFTGIRYFWETNREILKRCLFIKDGPLQIRAQYSKLVNPIRRFLIHAFNQGISVCILGQEKTGYFIDHLALIGKTAPTNQYFIPDHRYICEEIQHRPADGAPYGKDTNYGGKVFVKVGNRCQFVFSVPIVVGMDTFIRNPQVGNFIGFDRILATIPKLLSSKYENAIMPIELANSIASLSTYPSAQVLKIFADESIIKKPAF
jgi:hypothetical protein